MDAAHVLVALAGVAILVLAGWSRTEPGARWWFPARSQNMPRLVLWVGPLFGLVMLLAGLTPLTRPVPALRAVSTVVEVVALVAAVVGVFTAVPRWAVPGWLRERVRPPATPREDPHG